MNSDAEHFSEQGEVVVDTRCARCGGHHEGLTLRKLENPVQIKCPNDGWTVADTHWAPCPETGEPLLARWEETGG